MKKRVKTEEQENKKVEYINEVTEEYDDSLYTEKEEQIYDNGELVAIRNVLVPIEKDFDVVISDEVKRLKVLLLNGEITAEEKEKLLLLLS